MATSSLLPDDAPDSIASEETREVSASEAESASRFLPPSGGGEAERLETLDSYGVLDAPPGEAFNRITRLAKRLFGVDVAMVNFIDASEQWCVAAEGMPASRTPRDIVFCNRTIEQDEPLIIENASKDERFADNPFVTDAPEIRFYAGAPLVAPNGYRLGTLCLLDDEPQTLDEDGRKSLEDLAGVVMDELNLRYYASDLDVSRREYRAANQQKTQILESITDAFFALDGDWNFTYVNRQAEELLDRPREELLGNGVWDEFGEAVDSTFYQEYHRARDTGETAEFTEYYPPLGRWFEVKAFPFEDGLSVYFDDVTERIQAKEDLRRERDLTETIMSASVTAIVLVDADTECVSYLNDSAADLLGVDVDDAPGCHVTDSIRALKTLDGDEIPQEEWPFSEILETEQSMNDVRFVVVREDGSEVIISTNGAPLTNPDGSIRQVVFSIVDITEEIERQRELEEARDEAERASRLKSSFLANMSHDVRTPLSSIMSLTELLRHEAPERCLDRINLIEKSSNRLLDTIDSVLDLSRLESGSVEPEFQPLSVTEEILGTVEIFQAQQSKVELVTEVDEDDPLHARLDPTKLHRISDNLISNAMKFTDEGGRVTVRAYGDDDTVTIEVEDTGVGIEEEFLPDLFEAFSRSPEQKHQQGNGLGLAITRRLTDVMDGQIDVKSERGEGTRFIVTFPRAPDA